MSDGVAVPEVMKNRGDFGIQTEKAEDFECKNERRKFKFVGSAESSLGSDYNQNTPLSLRSYYRLLTLYGIGLGIASLSFMLELVMFYNLILELAFLKQKLFNSFRFSPKK